MTNTQRGHCQGWKGPHDLEARDRWGHTPLLHALVQGMEKEAMALLHAGASPMAVNQQGTSALMFALQYLPGMAAVFLDQQWHLVGQGGMGMLHIAALHRSTGEAIGKALLAKGLDVNARDADGTTPLMQACGEGRRLIPVFLEAGADVHAVDQDGHDALCWLFRGLRANDATAYIGTLIEAGAGQDSKVFERALGYAQEVGLDQVLLETVAGCRRQGMEQALPAHASRAVRARM